MGCGAFTVVWPYDKLSVAAQLPTGTLLNKVTLRRAVTTEFPKNKILSRKIPALVFFFFIYRARGIVGPLLLLHINFIHWKIIRLTNLNSIRKSWLNSTDQNSKHIAAVVILFLWVGRIGLSKVLYRSDINQKTTKKHNCSRYLLVSFIFTTEITLPYIFILFLVKWPESPAAPGGTAIPGPR